MNTLLSLLALSCLCGLSTALFGRGFLSRNPVVHSTKRDCQWMAWGTPGRCRQRGIGTFAALQMRDQIPAENGGNDCVGSSINYVSCTTLEYVASTFLDAVTSQARGSGGHHIITAPGLNPCAKPFTDAAGNIRMLGKPCKTQKRRRRSADGNIEVYEEPLKESIRVKRQTPMKHRDMLFLLDESGSVGSINFKKELRLAKAIISNLCGSIVVEKERTRIGILGFDSTQHPMLDFDVLFSKAQIFTYMDKRVTYTSSSAGSTCLNNALEFTRTQMFGANRGARNKRDSVEETIVLITDGCANCKTQGDVPTTLENMRKKLEDDKISILVYYIGPLGSSCRTLMEDLLTGGRCYELYDVLNWEELDATSAFIDDQPCTNSWQDAPSCS